MTTYQKLLYELLSKTENQTAEGVEQAITTVIDDYSEVNFDLKENRNSSL